MAEWVSLCESQRAQNLKTDELMTFQYGVAKAFLAGMQDQSTRGHGSGCGQPPVLCWYGRLCVVGAFDAWRGCRVGRGHGGAQGGPAFDVGSSAARLIVM